MRRTISLVLAVLLALSLLCGALAEEKTYDRVTVTYTYLSAGGRRIRVHEEEGRGEARVAGFLHKGRRPLRAHPERGRQLVPGLQHRERLHAHGFQGQHHQRRALYDPAVPGDGRRGLSPVRDAGGRLGLGQHLPIDGIPGLHL